MSLLKELLTSDFDTFTTKYPDCPKFINAATEWATEQDKQNFYI